MRLLEQAPMAALAPPTDCTQAIAPVAPRNVKPSTVAPPAPGPMIRIASIAGLAAETIASAPTRPEAITPACGPFDRGGLAELDVFAVASGGDLHGAAREHSVDAALDGRERVAADDERAAGRSGVWERNGRAWSERGVVVVHVDDRGRSRQREGDAAGGDCRARSGGLGREREYDGAGGDVRRAGRVEWWPSRSRS